MRKFVTLALAALMAATTFSTVGVTSAEAQRRWDGPRRHYAPPRHYGPRHHYPRRDYYRHRHSGSGFGAAAAGSIIGLAAGAIIAGSAARSSDAVAYCQQRFRSYDVRSGTYLGYDGLRHACP